MYEQSALPRIFPMREDYESTEELATLRRLLLDVISKLRFCADQIETAWDPETLRASFIELKASYDELVSLGVTSEYLAQFQEPGAGNFTETARNNPKIMAEWIAYDLVNIVSRLPDMKRPEDVFARTAALGFYENVLDAGE